MTSNRQEQISNEQLIYTDEFYWRIFLYLDPESLLNVSLVNHQMHAISKDQKIWKKKLKLHFPHYYRKYVGRESVDYYKKFKKAYREDYKELKPDQKKLFSLVNEGDFERVKSLIKVEDLLIEDGNEKNLALHTARQSSQQLRDHCFKNLIMAEANIHTIFEKMTHLNWMIFYNQLQFLETFKVQFASEIDAAIYFGHYHLVKEIINHIPDSKLPELFIDAASYGHVDIMKLIFHKGVNINNSLDGKTALGLASARGRHKAVKFLLENKADVNGSAFILEKPVRKGFVRITKLLLENKASVDTAGYRVDAAGYRNDLLDIATFENDTEIVKLLLSHNANPNPNMINTWDDTPLSNAARRGNLEAVRLLLNSKAEINLVTSSDNTPLIRAAETGHEGVVRFLLEKKADINILTNQGETALHRGVRHINTVKLLLAEGMGINAKDNDGCTPLYYASFRSDEKVVQFLLEKKLT